MLTANVKIPSNVITRQLQMSKLINQQSPANVKISIFTAHVKTPKRVNRKCQNSLLASPQNYKQIMTIKNKTD